MVQSHVEVWKIIISFNAGKNNSVVCRIWTRLIDYLHGKLKAATSLVSPNLQPNFLGRQRPTRTFPMPGGQMVLLQTFQVLAKKGNWVFYPSKSGRCEAAAVTLGA